MLSLTHTLAPSVARVGNFYGKHIKQQHKHIDMIYTHENQYKCTNNGIHRVKGVE